MEKSSFRHKARDQMTASSLVSDSTYRQYIVIFLCHWWLVVNSLLETEVQQNSFEVECENLYNINVFLTNEASLFNYFQSSWKMSTSLTTFLEHWKNKVIDKKNWCISSYFFLSLFNSPPMFLLLVLLLFFLINWFFSRD